MSDYITIGLLILIGLVFIIVEVLFVPGTTFVGVIGFIVSGVGIYLGFQKDLQTGWIVTIIAAAVSSLAIYVSFRQGLWSRFALKTEQVGNKSNPDLPDLQIGEVGKAISALRPAGNAEFNNHILEVSTLGGFVDAGSLLKIIQIESNRVLVEAILEE